jgi:GT2 family glycosyltransferase
MLVSIIIVNYNTTKLLLNCLFSIKSKTQNIDYEIIVVDNASTEVLDEITIDYPEIILLKLPTNIGFGKANNKGIEIAKGEYVFLLNSDTILLNNAVKVFADFMDNHKSEAIGAIGGQLLEMDGITKNHSSSAFPSFEAEFKEEVNRISRALLKKDILTKPNEKNILDNQNFIEVDYVTGADLFMPSSVLKKIGCFDPQFFMYYEETDLQKRMQKAGYKRLIIANTKIVHLEGGSFDATKKISGKRLLMIEESKFKYFKKHKSTAPYYIYRILYLFSSLPLLFKFAIPLEYRIKLLKTRLKF